MGFDHREVRHTLYWQNMFWDGVQSSSSQQRCRAKLARHNRCKCRQSNLYSIITFSLQLNSSEVLPQRPSRQAVVTGVFPPPPPPVRAFIFIPHRVQRSHFSAFNARQFSWNVLLLPRHETISHAHNPQSGRASRQRYRLSLSKERSKKSAVASSAHKIAQWTAQWGDSVRRRMDGVRASTCQRRTRGALPSRRPRLVVRSASCVCARPFVVDIISVTPPIKLW